MCTALMRTLLLCKEFMLHTWVLSILKYILALVIVILMFGCTSTAVRTARM